jgi:hypothetical protein
MARRIVEGFIWIPPDRNVAFSLTINGVDVKPELISGSFPHGLIGEDLSCTVELFNNDSKFNGAFAYGDEIVFSMDFTGGSTVQFRGYVQSIKSSLGQYGFSMTVQGVHYSGRLNEVMVTEEYTNVSVSDIRKDIISKYLPGFTSSNVEESGVNVQIFRVENKSVQECMIDLNNLGDEDCFLDNSKDFNSFVKNSHTNEIEAVVYNDSLLELSGFGIDGAIVRNSVKVIGDSGGLPVIYTSSDSNNQVTYGVKEKVIVDNSSNDEIIAEALGDAELVKSANVDSDGTCTCVFMPSIVPGYLTYVDSPPHNIRDKFRVAKMIYNIPDMTTSLYFSQERSIAKIFKAQMLSQNAMNTIVNPFKMSFSVNYTFDSTDKIDIASSSNVMVESGYLKLVSGITGTMIGTNKVTSSSVSEVNLQALGEILDSAVFSVSTNNGSSWEQVVLNGRTVLSNPGLNIKVKAVINSASTRIDSLAVLYK